MKYLLMILILLSTSSHVSATNKNAGDVRKFIRIGTGSISGVYYIAASSICKFIKKSNKITGNNVICSVQSTPGMIYNLNSIIDLDMEIGAIQADAEYKFYTEKGMKNMRSIFEIYDEMFTMVVRKDSTIHTLDDFKNKKVNIGAPGSGVSGGMDALMEAKNWTKKHFQVATRLNSSEQAQALCDKKIDVMTVMMASPNGVLQTAAATCGIRLIPVDEQTLNVLIERNPYYVKRLINSDIYGDNNTVATFAAKAMFVTRDDIDENLIYQIIKAVYENFDVFKKSHPALAHLKSSEIVPKGVSPIHPGALKFYNEIGLQ